MQLLIGHGQVPTIMPEASLFYILRKAYSQKERRKFIKNLCDIVPVGFTSRLFWRCPCRGCPFPYYVPTRGNKLRKKE